MWHWSRGYGLVFQSGHLGGFIEEAKGPLGAEAVSLRGAQAQPWIRH